MSCLLRCPHFKDQIMQFYFTSQMCTTVPGTSRGRHFKSCQRVDGAIYLLFQPETGKRNVPHLDCTM